MQENNCCNCKYLDSDNKKCLIVSGSPLRKCVEAINRNLVDDILKKQSKIKLLEIGCGCWSYVKDKTIDKIFWDGIDVEEKSMSGKPNIHTKLGSVEKIPFEDNVFDLVLANESMEHWFEYGVTLKKGLSEISRVLKNGGELMINVPIHVHGHRLFLEGKISKIEKLFNDKCWEIKRNISWRKNPAPLSPYRAWKEQVVTNCLPKKFNGNSWILEIVAQKRERMILRLFDRMIYALWKIFYKIFPKRILQLINYPKKATLNIILNKIKMIKKSLSDMVKRSFLRKYLLNFSIKLNTASYAWIKKFLTAPGEIHPKHRIVNHNKFFLSKMSPGDVVLDIGSHGGETCFALAPRVKKIVGIEIATPKFEEAKKKNNFTNVFFVNGDATTYNFASLGIDKFDKIILSNVLEHVDNRIELLKNILKLSDTVLLRVPMLTRDWLSVYKKEKGYEYRLDPEHKIEYTDESLKKELKEAGWEIKEKTVQFGETWAVLYKI